MGVYITMEGVWYGNDGTDMRRYGRVCAGTTSSVGVGMGSGGSGRGSVGRVEDVQAVDGCGVYYPH